MFGRQGGKQYIKSSEEILNEHDIFPISLKKSDQTYVDFCSSKKLSMDYWYDGINLLLSKFELLSVSDIQYITFFVLIIMTFINFKF